MEQLNYYEILEITENASVEVIKAAYRALAKKYHPDTYSGSEFDREKNMSQINEAYNTLSDEQKRKKYDEKIKLEKAYSNQYKKDKCEQKYKEYTNNTTTDEYNNEYDNFKNEYTEYDESDCEKESETQESGWFSKIVRGVGKEIVKSMQNNSREVENAYLSGLLMDDYLLVKRFKQASGYKRAGYCKALEEKGLLERNYEDKLIPTYRFKQFFDNN